MSYFHGRWVRGLFDLMFACAYVCLIWSVFVLFFYRELTHLTVYTNLAFRSYVLWWRQVNVRNVASIYSTNQRARKEKLVNAYLVSMCKDKPHQGILNYHSIFPGVFRVAFRQGLANAHVISIIQTIILFTIPSMPVRTCSAGYFLTIMRHTNG